MRTPCATEIAIATEENGLNEVTLSLPQVRLSEESYNIATGGQLKEFSVFGLRPVQL